MWNRSLSSHLSQTVKQLISRKSVLQLDCQTYFFKRCFHKSKILQASKSTADLSNPALEKYVRNLIANIETNSSLQPNEKNSLLYLWSSRNKLMDDMVILEKELSNDSNEDLKQLAEEEKTESRQKIADIDSNILSYILPSSSGLTSGVQSLFLEVTAGVGGQEAMLFASELIQMYEGFIAYNGWSQEDTEIDSSEIGGMRHGSMNISGKGAFEAFSFEAGVHRVQRVPKTEKSGRIHTSTVTVAVLPQPTEVQIDINPKDLKIETKRSSGAGGQHVNTTDSCVRIVHLPTGLAFEAQSERSQIMNRAKAMQKLRAKLFQIEIDRQELESRATRKLQVGSSMRSEKIRTYNYPQDRVTDHRIGKNLYNIRGFLMGGEILAEVMQELRDKKKADELQEFLASIR